MTSLDERLDAPESGPWMPEQGDSVAGQVLEVTERRNEYNPDGYPLVILDAGGRVVEIHAFHDVLSNELARLEVQAGDNIGVKYLGRKNGDGYHKYRVVKGGPPPAFAWGRYRAPDEHPPPDEGQHDPDADDPPF